MVDIDFSAGTIYPSSVVTEEGTTYFLARLHENGERRLGVLGDTADFIETIRANAQITLCPLSVHNAAVLQARLPWLKPTPLGLTTSFGFGDRLGLATPGHIQALREVDPKGVIAPVFAQQSVRENTRTERTPQQVLNDAIWGIFQEGWRKPWGADADHVKQTASLEVFVATGYTFVTIDPGDHVNAAAASASLDDLRIAAENLPFDLQPDATNLLSRTLDIEGHLIDFDEPTLLKAAVKYGKAVAHTAALYQHLVAMPGGRQCDLEISVDETEQPTSPAEHVYIAGALQRLGVRWVSLAPRFTGRFEKGVDYIGDLTTLEADFAVHAAIARQFGPYKLSLHSGSDKFSAYPIAIRQTRGLLHVKTAGTSYLEALRTIASLDPAFFHSIYAFARQRYETDRASYFVSASLGCAPLPDDVADADLPLLLEQFDAREILHVTFGAVLTEQRFREHVFDLLRTNAGEYAANLQKHFARHLKPLCQES